MIQQTIFGEIGETGDPNNINRSIIPTGWKTPDDHTLGIYRIDFTSSFADRPFVVASTSGGGRYAVVIAAEKDHCIIEVHNHIGAKQDGGFYFVAIGVAA